MFSPKRLLLIVIMMVGSLLAWQAELVGAGTTATSSAAPVAIQATIGSGTAASCQSNAAVNAFSNAVAAGGVIDFNCGPGTVMMLVNTSVTDQTVTINGDGRIILSGEDLRQLFLLSGPANLTLNDIILVDGSASQGGAIYIGSQATVTINRSFLTSNGASTLGGAVYNLGTLTINHSSLGSNISGGNGGGIYNSGGTVTLRDSYLISNQAVNGGGLYTVNGQVGLERTAVRSNISSNAGGGINAAGNMQISNSTFSNNQAFQGGGLYAASSTITILNATFNENRADQGGAIYKHAASTTSVKNSIMAGSLTSLGSPTLNCDGPALISQGRNIISDNSCVANPSPVGDLHGTNPQLGLWLGSPTRAYIPEASSPAVDYGLGCPAMDQRGYPRPLGAACDVGSIERGWLIFLPMVMR
jgi:predicted outer membrane repeat protein